MIRAMVRSGVDLHVVYGPMAHERSVYDGELGRTQPWDIPLLVGYPFQIVDSPFWFGPAGLWCLRKRIRKMLESMEPDVVWVHGWGNVYSIAAWNVAWQLGIPVMLRGESHLDCLRGGWFRRWLHRHFLRRFFGTVSVFLAIGSANRAFYRAYGAPESRIVDMPYAVDNDRFSQMSEDAELQVLDWRQKLGIAPSEVVIGFCGKLKPSKRPDLVFKAVLDACEHLPNSRKPWLLFVGDGALRESLEKLTAHLGIERVRFLGFQNQSKLPALYQLMDLLVLPSDFEPWGLVINEAMCAGCAVIASDKVGAVADLVISGKTGSVFQSGNTAQLASCISTLLASLPDLKKAGESGRELVKRWNYEADLKGLKNALEVIRQQVQQQPVSGSKKRLQLPKQVTVSYMGVHQAFQLALAAHEGGLLKKFHTSVLDAPGKWGGMASRIFGPDRMVNRRVKGLDETLVAEYPWPLLWKMIRDRFAPSLSLDWTSISDAFDRQAAQHFLNDPSQVFVGTETCALLGMSAARSCGATTVLDCPQLHPQLLRSLMLQAAEQAKMAINVFIDFPDMADRKQREYEMADHLLIYSEIHRRSFLMAGFDEKRLFECPLWVDPALWHPDSFESSSKEKKRLQVLFVGSLSLRKGIPFLLKAFELGQGAWDLTLVGPVSRECVPILAKFEGRIRVLEAQKKVQLRKLYSSHDLFVLPSVVDTFGFVALEAMACGTPALVSENCGAPVPDASWRFPAMDPVATNELIMTYALSPTKVRTHSVIARQFAQQFTPGQYRRCILGFYRQVLDLPAIGS